ncbi:MAG: hypothetical protein EON86_05750 [Brevundimonas sp.]|nr:MAG: hypothetical protein EON86_05750 [Brevundimonas sp.]
MSDDPLAALRLRFRERALSDADGLASALQHSNEQDIEALAHGLAGAAGLFGFSEIGRQAKDIDGQFAAGDRPARSDVEALIAAIRRDMAAYS